jgi:uncharacterized protein YdeI (YjbR/CyaY-like superfamily)
MSFGNKRQQVDLKALKPLSFTTRRQWRAWLKAHHRREAQVWLALYKKGERTPSLSIAEAQEEALCFGWIDHLSRSLDQSRFLLRFTPRRAGSIWSLTNIRRVEKLTGAGLMTQAGLEKVAEARRNGQWEAAIAREQTERIPAELEKSLRRRKGALAGYRSLTPSRKKQLVHWLLTAKSEATRQRRLQAILQEAAG